jgi:hypothetical protein
VKVPEPVAVVVAVLTATAPANTGGAKVAVPELVADPMLRLAVPVTGSVKEAVPEAVIAVFRFADAV